MYANLYSPLQSISVKNPFELRRFCSDECSCNHVCIAQKRYRPKCGLGFTIEDICHLSEGQVSVEKAFELWRFLGNKCSRNSLYVVMFTSGGRVLDLSMAQDSQLRIFVTCQRCRSMLKDL